MADWKIEAHDNSGFCGWVRSSVYNTSDKEQVTKHRALAANFSHQSSAEARAKTIAHHLPDFTLIATNQVHGDD